MNAMNKTKTVVISALVLLVFTLILCIVFLFHGDDERDGKIGMAVEFMDHAAAAYIAKDKGWYEQQGLDLLAYESYTTGMALATALAGEDIQVAYICLVPAINAYANAGVPIKIVAGTHKYGYALVVNPDVVSQVQDLANDGIRIGCVREGGAVDVLLNRTIEKYGLDRDGVLNKVRRMDPSKQLLAVKSRQLDAVFLPEQWATMAENLGFQMILTSRDVWPRMQGSVLAVKEELVLDDPEFVRKLVVVTRDATEWINEHPEKSAEIMAKQLSIIHDEVIPLKASRLASQLEITPATMMRSMNRLEYSTDFLFEDLQEVIDYMAYLGYIKKSFPAEEIVDQQFLN